MDKAKLEVKPAKRQKDEGNSLARVNGEVFKDLGLKEGDVIQIKGERKLG